MNLEQLIRERIQEVERQVSNNNLNDGIKKLLDIAKDTNFTGGNFREESVILSSRYNRLKNAKHKGLINFEQYSIEQNQIVEGILNLLQRIRAINSEKEEKNTLFTFDEQRSYDEEKKHFFEKLEGKEKEEGKYLCILDGVFKSFRKNKNFQLQEVNLKVGMRDIVGILGENAAGKSTLLNMVAGIITPTKGKISYPRLTQESKSWKAIKLQIGYIPQTLIPWNGRLRENLYFSASTVGIKGKENEKEVAWVIERLGLNTYVKARFNELSGGYKMRFALASILVRRPKLLILDEPLSNLDVNAQIQFLNDIKGLSDSLQHPLGVLISSQHIHEIEHICNKMLFIQNGEVIFNDQIDKVKYLHGEDNVFEINSPPQTGQQNYQLLFKGIPVNKIVDKGAVLIISTPSYYQRNRFVQDLLNIGYDLKYFREITDSTKKLFSP